jgi:hypothetical protein
MYVATDLAGCLGAGVIAMGITSEILRCAQDDSAIY